MELKSLIAMAGVAAALALAGSPSQAQPKPATFAHGARLRQLPREAHASIDLGPHGAKNDAQGSMCQACHGDATEHLKDPTKAKPPGSAASKGRDRPTKTRGLPDLPHRAAATSRSGSRASTRRTRSPARNCHNIHDRPRSGRVAPFTTTFRPNEADTCGNCHQQVRTATLKPSHHPIIEGKIKCSRLPQPARRAHAGDAASTRPSTSSATPATPTSAGPYVFAHPPVEENCLSCHNPHGSVHAKLLNEKAPNLCQDCHDVVAASGHHLWRRRGVHVHAGRTRIRRTACFARHRDRPTPSVNTRFIARACLNCHNRSTGRTRRRPRQVPHPLTEETIMT